MSVTSGFFNSLAGDRRYNAEQMSAIFDGIINDGVFASIGDCFGVRATTGNEITVGTGRAWFSSAWLYNDAVLPLTAEVSELVLHRYDAVVIEIDHSEAVRQGSIKIVKGTPASSPKFPEMVRTAYVNQYPLAYIYRSAGSTEITQANITNKIGTSDCPYVTAILQVTNIDNIVAQWQGEWEEWSGQWEHWMLQWEQWFNEQKTETDQETNQWMSEMKSTFEVWFNSLKLILDGDVATNLGNAVVELQQRFETLASERAVYEAMRDNNNDTILDSNNNPIEGRTVMSASAGESEGGSGGGDIDLSDITPEDIGAAREHHAQQHSKTGSDPIKPVDIGAAEESHNHQWTDLEGLPKTFPTAWNEVQNKPTVFPPSTHTHSEYLPTAGGTMNGLLTIADNIDLAMVHGHLSIDGYIQGYTRLTTGTPSANGDIRIRDVRNIDMTGDIESKGSSPTCKLRATSTRDNSLELWRSNDDHTWKIEAYDYDNSGKDVTIELDLDRSATTGAVSFGVDGVTYRMNLDSLESVALREAPMKALLGMDGETL